MSNLYNSRKNLFKKPSGLPSAFLSSDTPIKKKESSLKKLPNIELAEDLYDKVENYSPSVPINNFTSSPVLASKKPLVLTNDFDRKKFKDDTYAKESRGLGGYNATNKVSSAVGKYQFIYSLYGADIAKVTGAKTKEEFRKNPAAQERYMDHFIDTNVLPYVDKYKKLGKSKGLNTNQIAHLVHFQGAGGAKKELLKSAFSSKTTTNSSVLDYIGKTK